MWNRFYAAVATVFILPTLKYFFLDDQKMDLNNTNQLFEKQSQVMESELEKVSTLLFKENEWESSTEKVEPQHLQNFRRLDQEKDQSECNFQNDEKTKNDNTNQNFEQQSERTEEVPTPLIEDRKFQQEDAQSLGLSFTEVIFDQDFFILLIQPLRDVLVSILPAAFHNMISVGLLVGLVFSFAVTVIVGKKLTKRNMDLEKKMPQLQSDFQGHESLVNTLMEVNAELENQRDQLKEQLEEMERKREENKLKLQALETEIKKETTFKEKDELLRKKEKLLQEEWRLDEKKKDIKSQVQNMERLHGPIEVQVARLYQK